MFQMSLIQLIVVVLVIAWPANQDHQVLAFKRGLVGVKVFSDFSGGRDKDKLFFTDVGVKIGYDKDQNGYGKDKDGHGKKGGYNGSPFYSLGGGGYGDGKGGGKGWGDYDKMWGPNSGHHYGHHDYDEGTYARWKKLGIVHPEGLYYDGE